MPVALVSISIPNAGHSLKFSSRPKSDIVLTAFHVTNYLKNVVDKLADNRRKELGQKRKIELSQMMNDESATRGDLLSTRSRKKKTSIPANEVDEYGAVFDGALDRTWLGSTIPDGTWNLEGASETSARHLGPWVPQCGDRIIYNRVDHANFIKGHLDVLKSTQRSLPSILPPTNKKNKKSSESKTSNEDENQQGSEGYQDWLGTIIWVRAVFPNAEMAKRSVYLSPLYAIGIKFHYKWLAKSVHVVYWRPCLASFNNDNQSPPLRHSFISPAWTSNMDRVLPPYPLSFSFVAQPPGVPSPYRETIVQCMDVLKKRIVKKLDAFDFLPNQKLLEYVNSPCSITSIPQRFLHIFEDTSTLHEQVPGDEVSASVSSSAHKDLAKHGFVTPWTFSSETEIIDKVVSTRKTKSAIKDATHRVITPFHDTIIANTWLSVDFIIKRVKGGYYRSNLAILNDLREGAMAAVLYTLKERIRSKRLGKASEEIVLKAFITLCGVDVDAFLTEDKKSKKSKSNSSKNKSNVKFGQTNGSNDLLGPNHHAISEGDRQTPAKDRSTHCVKVNVNKFNYQERAILLDLQRIYRLYATAIVSCNHTSTAEMALGCKVRALSRDNEDLSDEKEVARKNINWILSSLGPDKMKFRKPIAGGDAPTVKVFVKIKTPHDPNHTQDSASVETCSTNKLVLVPSDYEGHPELLKVLGPVLSGKSNKPNISIAINLKQMDELLNETEDTDIILLPDEYKKMRPLYNFLGPFKRGKALAPYRVSIVSEDFCVQRVLKEVNTVDDAHDKKLDVVQFPNLEEDVAHTDGNGTDGNVSGSENRSASDGSLDMNTKNAVTEAECEHDSTIEVTKSSEDSNTLNESSEEKDVWADIDLEDVDMSEPLAFVPADYHNNTSLVRALFCRSKRRKVCARCVIAKKGLFSCRVRSAHSNLDPTWIDYYRSVRGVDGILARADPEYRPQVAALICQDLEGDLELGPVPSEQATKKDDDENFQNKPEPSTSEEDLIKAISCASEAHLKAKEAVNLSGVLLRRAESEMETPLLLSSEFMYASFTVDPDDGHFEICPHCGLGGDVICCESCPMVAHPKCVGMDSIPEEDWHCYTCTEKAKASKMQLETESHSDKTTTINDEAESGVSSDQLTEALATMLEELKSSRQRNQVSVVLGTKIIREFDGKPYTGEVIELPSDSLEYYKVLYEDDDEEDFTLEEIQPCIIAYHKKKKADDSKQDQDSAQLPMKKIDKPRKSPVEQMVDLSGTLKRGRKPPKIETFFWR